MVMGHAVDHQVLHRNDAVGTDNLSACLMGEVVSPEGDPLMHTCNRFAMLASLRCAFCQLTVLVLDACQGLFFFPKEAGVGNLFPAGKGGKGLESHINPDLFEAFWQAFRLTFYRERDVPLASRRTMNGTCFDLASDSAMVDHLDSADLGEDNVIIVRDAKTTLREGEAVIAVNPSETREAWFLTSFAPAKEGLKRQINTHRDILQDLGMHLFEGGTFLFQ